MQRILIISALSLSLVACGGNSPDAVCKHLVELGKKEGMDKAMGEKAMEGCVKEMKEEKAKMGDEMWGKVASCITGLKSMKDMDKCDPEKLGAKSGGGGGGEKAKATEAKQFVKKMYDGARAYYMESGAGKSLTPIEPQFPGPSVGPVPALGACCKAGGKCAPEAAAWTAPTWIALQFSVDDPHYYSYEYKVGADNKSFEVMAYGDLDCDGEYSTYKMSGAVKPGEDGPAGSAKFEETKPLE